MVFLGWFIGSIALGIWADSRERSGFGWFCIALITSPLLAGLLLLALPHGKEGRIAQEALANSYQVAAERFVDQVSKSHLLVSKKIIEEDEHRRLVEELIRQIRACGIKGTETDFLVAVVGLSDSGAVTREEIEDIKDAFEARKFPFPRDQAS